MPGACFLSGDRVTLKTIEAEDIIIIQRWVNNPEVRRYIHEFRLPYSREDCEKWLPEARDDRARVDLLVCLENEPIGRARLEPFHTKRRAANLGFLIAPEHQGNGYATETAELLVEYGFTDLLLHRLEAKALAPNSGSRRVLEKIGFVEEGHKRKAAIADGEYVDEVYYGLLRTDWESKSKK
ncbi:GNAT family N-acetyltransferase [halophilic archaeon]|nr:GNAT family N-acetyltransferase [halophilic archaeon]